MNASSKFAEAILFGIHGHYMLIALNMPGIPITQCVGPGQVVFVVFEKCVGSLIRWWCHFKQEATDQYSREAAFGGHVHLCYEDKDCL